MESLIKLHYYNQVLASADNLLFNGPVTDWKLKWLQRANVDTNKVKWVSNTSHVECEQLIFTSRLINDQQISYWSINALKSLLNIQPAINEGIKAKKIIWVSRKGLKERDLEWENEILAIFPEIEKVELSDLDVASTIDKFQSASHVIGPHGAGLSNIYLCSPGTKILEIYPVSAYFQPYFHRIAMICKLKHSIMYLDFKDQKNHENGLNAFKEAFFKFIC